MRGVAKHADLRFGSRLDGPDRHRAAGRGGRPVARRRQVVLGAAHVGDLVGRGNLRLSERSEQE